MSDISTSTDKPEIKTPERPSFAEDSPGPRAGDVTLQTESLAESMVGIWYLSDPSDEARYAKLQLDRSDSQAMGEVGVIGDWPFQAPQPQRWVFLMGTQLILSTADGQRVFSGKVDPDNPDSFSTLVGAPQPALTLARHKN